MQDGDVPLPSIVKGSSVRETVRGQVKSIKTSLCLCLVCGSVRASA